MINIKLENMDLVTQHIVMAKDLNSYGNLFGGVILAWIDEAAAIYVMEKIKYTNIVTVKMDEVSFNYPGKFGDVIQIYASIEKTGSSSITVVTRAIAMNKKTYEKHEITSSRLVFVCLDETGKPYPFFKK